MTDYCKICGEELEDEEIEEATGVCWVCQSILLQEDGIDLGFEIEDDEIY